MFQESPPINWGRNWRSWRGGRLTPRRGRSLPMSTHRMGTTLTSRLRLLRNSRVRWSVQQSTNMYTNSLPNHRGALYTIHLVFVLFEFEHIWFHLRKVGVLCGSWLYREGVPPCLPPRERPKPHGFPQSQVTDRRLVFLSWTKRIHTKTMIAMTKSNQVFVVSLKITRGFFSAYCLLDYLKTVHALKKKGFQIRASLDKNRE